MSSSNRLHLDQVSYEALHAEPLFWIQAYFEPLNAFHPGLQAKNSSKARILKMLEPWFSQRRAAFPVIAAASSTVICTSTLTTWTVTASGSNSSTFLGLFAQDMLGTAFSCKPSAPCNKDRRTHVLTLLAPKTLRLYKLQYKDCGLYSALQVCSYHSTAGFATRLAEH